MRREGGVVHQEPQVVPAVSALLLAAALLAAPPVAELRTTTAGGWVIAGAADGIESGKPAWDASGSRALQVRYLKKDDGTVVRSEARVIDSKGAVLRTVNLNAWLPVDWALTLDGAAAAVLIQDPADTDGASKLAVFAVASKAAPAMIAADLDARIVGGKTMFAIAPPPPWLPEEPTEQEDDGDTEEEDETIDRTITAPEAMEWTESTDPFPKAELIAFVTAAGDRVASMTPMAGDIAAAGDGFVSLGNGFLTRIDGQRKKTWSVNVGFEGRVAASADGTLILAADFTRGSKPRKVLVFDGAGKPLAEVSVAAAYAVALAAAPDGSAFLAAPASIEHAGNQLLDAKGEAMLTCFSRDGSIRWVKARERDVPGRDWTDLALSAGGKRAAAGWTVPGDEEESPELLLLDGVGGERYAVEGPFRSLALTKDGSALWTDEITQLSRHPVSALKAR